MQDTPIYPITPSFVPIKCPVCNGFGTVNFGKQTCNSCKGEGFIKVPPKIEDEEGDANANELLN